MKKEFRVCKNYEFSSIIQNRTYIKSSSFVCYFQARKEEHARIGISVGKKLGNEEYDLIIIVRPAYHKKSYKENFDELKINKRRLDKRFRK